MLKIMLVNLPITDANAAFFPYGLESIASYLKSKNIEVEICDAVAEDLNEKGIVKSIENWGGKVVGISAMSTQYQIVKNLSRLIKQSMPDVKIILGGLLAIYSYDVVLQNTQVDICVVGEGELISEELLTSLDKLDSVKGIAFKRNGRIKFNGYGEIIKDINMLPPTNYEMLDMDKYAKSILRATGGSIISNRLRTKEKKIMIYLTGRGCPYNCTFCSKISRFVRLKSIERIACELNILKNKYNIYGLSIVDELCVISKKRIFDICEAIKPFNFVWDCQARVDLVDPEILIKMREAGCIGVAYGIESGSQEILSKINKGINVKDTENAIKWTEDAGMQVKVDLIFGFPDDTTETVQETVDLFKRLGHPGRRFLLLTPLPGSEIYDMAKKQRKIIDEEKYLTSISGTFPTKYNLNGFTNLTRFEDEDFLAFLDNAEKAMIRNYHIHLIKHPLAIWKRIIKPSLENPKYFVKSFLNMLRTSLPKVLKYK